MVDTIERKGRSVEKKGETEILFIIIQLLQSWCPHPNKISKNVFY